MNILMKGYLNVLGLPEWLIANTVDEYVERAIRLAENHQERFRTSPSYH